MDVKIKSSLTDILICIKEIDDFIGNNKDFFTYKFDLKTKKAVERNLEIIGEAVNRIMKLDDQFPISNSKNIVGTRNRIIHSYDNISDEVIWTIVNRELPELKNEVLKHLE
jgi:uncharacterized protein with HEPN domain